MKMSLKANILLREKAKFPAVWTLSKVTSTFNRRRWVIIIIKINTLGTFFLSTQGTALQCCSRIDNNIISFHLKIHLLLPRN